MPVYPVMNTDVTLWYFFLTYSWSYKCDHIWDFRQMFLQFHFFASFIRLCNQFPSKTPNISFYCYQFACENSDINWLALIYQIIIYFNIFDNSLFQWARLISPLQSVHLHRQQFWQRMNQNVEIGSLPICFNLWDNLFVFV